MRGLGLLARFSYRLSRHRLLGLPLDGVAGALAGGATLYAVIMAIVAGRWPIHLPFVAALGLWSLVALNMRWRGFLVYRPVSTEELRGPQLPPFEKIPVRGCGLFQVHGRTRRFVEAPGTLEATELGDRVLMVKVQPVSLLGLMASPEEEWGWWYVVFRPEELMSVETGEIYFGWQPRAALRLVHRAAEQPVTYLSFDDVAARDRVARDLRWAGAEPGRSA